ncbi:MAG: 3-phosphoshikimate 1-carboxyvinyltransferase [Candidatus Anammoxibacter sp.]
MIEIKPVKNIDAVIKVPGSKSYTNRALIIGALAEGNTVINNALFSDDTKYMIAALTDLGIDVAEDNDKRKIFINGHGGKIPCKSSNLFVGNAGTAMRFLTAMLTTSNGVYIIDGVERMRSRPINDLLDGLNQLGGNVSSNNGAGCPPVLIKPGPLKGGACNIKGNLSSQYISAILMAAPYAKSDVTINITGDLVSKKYVDMTLALMEYFGVSVENESYKKFFIKKNQQYTAKEYYVEADASSASYFLAAAAITKGRVRIEGLGNNSIQGDICFVDLLEKMGCKIKKGEDFIEITGGELKGIDVDMSNMPDVAQTLAVVAVFAKGKTRVRNVGNLRIKETDRIAGVVNELQRVGVKCTEHDDGFEIEPSVPHAAEIETYDDHRMAMSFALIGLVVDGIKIKNPECVTKTFPGFFEELEKLYLKTPSKS